MFTYKTFKTKAFFTLVAFLLIALSALLSETARAHEGGHILDVLITPGSNASVTTSPPMPAGGYAHGTVVTVSVYSGSSDYTFYGWNGVSASSGNTATLTIEGDKTIRAVFVQNTRPQTMKEIYFVNQVSREAVVWLFDYPSFLSGSRVDDGVTISPGWRLFSAADWNNDSMTDLLFQNNITGHLAVWKMSGTHIIQEQVLRDGRAPALEWRASGAADFDGNGYKDILFFGTNSRRLALWKMGSDGFIATMLLREGKAVGSGWRAVAVGDIDKNNSPDIIFRHTEGRLAAWLMNGTSFGSVISLRNGRNAALYWRVVALTDFDSNGSNDIIWQHNDGRLAVWYMHGTTYGSSAPIRNGVTHGPTWKAVGAR